MCGACTHSEQEHGEPLVFPTFSYKYNLSQAGYKMFLPVLNICFHPPSTQLIENYFQRATVSKKAEIFWTHLLLYLKYKYEKLYFFKQISTLS